MDAAELLKALAQLSPEQKAAAAAILGAPQGPRNDTPKFSTALDQVADADVPKVVDAAIKGIEFAAANPSIEHEAVKFLQEVAPVVASAAQNNSSYRRKPITHSLRVAAEYLQSDEAEDRRAKRRRESARRRIPSTTAPAAPAPSPSAPQAGSSGKDK